MKKGIALCGGGAKSFCQIGVLKILEKEGISFDVITGTSMGALIGTIYSFTGNSEKLEDTIFRIFENKEFKKIEKIFSKKKDNYFSRIFSGIKDLSLLLIGGFKTGLFDSEKIKERIYNYFERDIYFEECKKTLGIIATEYFTGKIVIFNKGKIIPSLIASCAIPGLVTPVKIKNKYYVDGGVTSNIPVIANFILGGEKIIGIENNSYLDRNMPLNTFEVFVQMEKIKTDYSSIIERLLADFILKIDLPEMEWFNFSKLKECIKLGEKSAEKNLKIITKVINNENKTNFRKDIIEKISSYFSTEHSM
ncbi:MAG: patatin-like phospholipase family protein [Candidatus Omnitrophica bacterium]|nr:patatin-like phospholipase family protein [Candidatus Omnitrophota bacterium]